MVDGVNVIYYRKLLSHQLFPRIFSSIAVNIMLQRRYSKTINRFNLLGSWRLININPVLRRDLDTVDFEIHLTPATKYSFTTNVEGSRNQSTISGNLFGLALNVGVAKQEFFKSR